MSTIIVNSIQPLSGTNLTVVGDLTANSVRLTQGIVLSGGTPVEDALVKLSQPNMEPWLFGFYNENFSANTMAFGGWVADDGQTYVGTELDKPFNIYANREYFNPEMSVSSSGVYVKGSLSAATLYGDGSNLTGISGGTGNPGGSNGQVQYNDNGSFGASSGLTFDSNTGLLSSTAFAGDGSQITNVSAAVYFDVTYSELVDKITGATLDAGNYYRITDYRTCYDQPKYEISRMPSLSGDYKTAAVHPILVQAISNSELAIDAYQPDYPNDKLKYDFDYNLTFKSQSPAYGRIIERVDEFNNRTDYDHREVLFRRYRNFYHDALPLNGMINIDSDGTVQGIAVGGDAPQFNVDFSPGDFLVIPEFTEYVFEVLTVNSFDSMTVTGVSMVSGSNLKYHKGYRATTDENLRGYNSYYPNNIDGTEDFQEFTTFQYKTPANFMQRALWTLNRDYSEITNLVPNIYMFWDDREFSDASVGINDGGDDMYDGGNFLNTDLTNLYGTINQGEIGSNQTLAKSSIPYTHTQAENEDDDNEYVNPPKDGKIKDGTPYFGSGSTYFTNMYPGLFIMVADNVSVSEFSITGDVGSDDDTINAGIVEEIASGWTLFYKTNHGDTSDPSINHLILLPGTSSGVTHVFEDNDGIDFDDHAVLDITDRKRIVYALVATQPGDGPLAESDAIAVSEQILLTVAGQGETVVNNRIGDFYSLMDWEGYEFDLPNNVFGEDVINNVIGAGFQNNTFVNDMEETRIADYCTNNIYEGQSDFDDNVIGNFFQGNRIRNGFSSNKIYDGFSDNYITIFMEDNAIGSEFTQNTIAGASNFFNNQIGNAFSQNLIYAAFRGNVITDNFDLNSIYFVFTQNRIGSEFNTNTIGTRNSVNGFIFENNDIQKNFKGNQILNNFWSNRIKTDFKANLTTSEFGYCNIGFGCFSNSFSGVTTHNKFGDYFTFNTFSGSCCYNTIGTGFQSNEIEDGFGFGMGSYQGNIIGNNFYDNTIGEYFYNNKIMDSFTNNVVGNYFQQNNVTNEVSGYNFTEATHVYGFYNCDIFRNSASSFRLSYYDGNDVLTITDITA